jgi:hypothetical protein
MNGLQRLVLLVGMIAVVGMGIYPPWIRTRHVGGLYGGDQVIRSSWPAGYRLITQPPTGAYCVSVNMAQLAAQEIIALIATAMGVLVFKDRKVGSPGETAGVQVGSPENSKG